VQNRKAINLSPLGLAAQAGGRRARIGFAGDD